MNLSYIRPMIQAENIIFDLGGVIIDIDYQKTEDAFIALGFGDFHEKYSQLKQNTFFDDFETGRMDEAAFVNGIAGMLPEENVSAVQITTAWNAMLLDFPLRRLQLLQQLQLHYNTFILSNTNIIHERCFNRKLQQQAGIPSLGLLVDKAYYSHRIGLRKPGADAFEYVLDQNHLNPAQTVFIDDTLPNIEAAEKVGLQTIYLEKGMTIEQHVFRKE